MKIAVIGTGYVGLVTSTCLAESGNEVAGIDKDQRKIDVLLSGRLPIYEPGLLELVQRNTRDGRMSFTTDLAKACAGARLIFVAVGTPQSHDGASDLSNIWAVIDALAGVSCSGANRRPQEHGPGRHQPHGRGTAASALRPAGRCGQQPGVPQGRRGGGRFHAAGPGGGRRAPAGSRRSSQGVVCPLPADRAAVPGHVARKRRDDQVRGQRHAGDQDQLHQ